MENYGNPYGNQDNKQSATLYFFSIAKAIEKKIVPCILFILFVF